jgi:predicted short-subunit dehydrogenase-like oxidoreductase (DUF2520 family)
MRACADFDGLNFERGDFEGSDFGCRDFTDFAIASILRYAARVRRTEPSLKRTERRLKNRRPTIAIVGAGSLAQSLTPALRGAGYTITEIILRAQAGRESLRRGRTLARRVGARAVTVENAALDASVVWLCVPDRQIRAVAAALAERVPWSATRRGSSRLQFAFHSSGALLCDELAPLRKAGVAIASVHPLMTFVAGARAALAGVPFAVEGDAAATRIAGRVVRELGGESFILPASRKAAYHAWATMTSPLLVAYLGTLEEAARGAGLAREEARRLSLPIVLQTLGNYGRLGPANSFSGPFVRGDAQTVAKHLALLGSNPDVHAVYVALARAALKRLPVKNRAEIQRLLE